MPYAEAEIADRQAPPVSRPPVSRSLVPNTGSPGANGKRIALVHEWLDTFAGSESVLEQLLICFPNADVYAVVDFMKPEDRRFLDGRTVKTTFIQRLPGARRMFRNYLGLMPLAIEQLDMSGYDLIISSSHAVAKGVLTGPNQIHISYVHSPMRYIWDLQQQYLKQSRLGWGLKALYVRWLFTRLRQWDASSAQHVDHFLANSSYIARRMKKAYGRDATVVHPPVDVERFSLGKAKDDFFLLAGRMVGYKCAALIVEAFRMQPERRLIVVGDGPEAARVKAVARGASNIEFRGQVPKAMLIDLMQRARAAVFAAEEDFGIAMVEVQACGTPVIAFGRGGVTDIIKPDGASKPTGVLFDRQELGSVLDALARFDLMRDEITPDACRDNALRFSRARFRGDIRAFVEDALA